MPFIRPTVRLAVALLSTTTLWACTDEAASGEASAATTERGDDAAYLAADFTLPNGSKTVSLRTRPEDEDDFGVNALGDQLFNVKLSHLLDESEKGAPFEQISMQLLQKQTGTFQLGEGRPASLNLYPYSKEFGDQPNDWRPALISKSGTMTIEAIDFDNETAIGSFDGTFEWTNDGDSDVETLFEASGRFHIDGRPHDEKRRQERAARKAEK